MSKIHCRHLGFSNYLLTCLELQFSRGMNLVIRFYVTDRRPLCTHAPCISMLCLPPDLMVCRPSMAQYGYPILLAEAPRMKQIACDGIGSHSTNPNAFSMNSGTFLEPKFLSPSSLTPNIPEVHGLSPNFSSNSGFMGGCILWHRTPLPPGNADVKLKPVRRHLLPACRNLLGFTTRI